MIRYFATPGSDPGVRAAMLAGRIGWMDTPAQGNRRPSGLVWAADTGCFNPARYPGDQAWWRWLHRHHDDAHRCAFATAPDVVGSHTDTLARSLPWLSRISELGYRAAFVAQNGASPAEMPWDCFDVLFLGGSPECGGCGFVWPVSQRAQRRQPCPRCGHVMCEWKLGPAARTLVTAARAHGLGVHMGRVNSLRRLRYAAQLGVDSVDGTYLSYGPRRNLPRLLGWLDTLDRLAGHEPTAA